MLLDLFNREGKLEGMVFEVQQGNDDLRNQLLHDYGPFIRTVVSKNCKKFITTSDEEYSIGLIAFNEAMDKYCKSNKAKFLTFSSLVIKRRLIDYIRKDKTDNETSLSIYPASLEDDDTSEHFAIVKNSIEIHSEELENEKRTDEILSFKKSLGFFNISFEKLSEVSPKHKDTRLKSMEVAKVITESPNIKERLYTRKQLPINDLLPLVDVKKKTLERNRIYIIALTIILTEDFPYMKDFLK